MKNNFARPGYFSVSIKYFFILFLFSGLLLTGCGGSEDEDPAPNNPNTPGSTEDTTPPEITSIDPADGASDVPIDVVIKFTFTEPLDINTIKTGTLVLSGGASANLAWNFTMTGSTAVLTPDNELQYGTEYTVRLTTDVTDKAGNKLAQSFTSRFTTADAPDDTPPKVNSTTPATGAQYVGLNTEIKVQFSEPIASTFLSSSYFSLKYNGQTSAVSVSQSGSLVTVKPTNGLRGGPTSYTLEISSNIEDQAGNKLGTAYALNFSTENQEFRPNADFSPKENVTITGSELSLSFYNDLDASTVNNNTVKVIRNGSSVSIELRVQGKTIFIKPQGELREYASSYSVKFSGGINGIRDVKGNTLTGGDAGASFTTEVVSEDYFYEIRANTGSSYAYLWAGSTSPYSLYKDIRYTSKPMHWYFDKFQNGTGIGNRNTMDKGDDFLIEGSAPNDGNAARLNARPSAGSAYGGQLWTFQKVSDNEDWFYLHNNYWQAYLRNSDLDVEVNSNPDKINQWRFIRSDKR